MIAIETLTQQMHDMKYEINETSSLFRQFRAYLNNQLATIYEQLSQLENRSTQKEYKQLAQSSVNKNIQTLEESIDSVIFQLQAQKEDTTRYNSEVSSLKLEISQLKQHLARWVEA